MFCVLARYACVCVRAEEVGGGSLCNLKGKYKAHTKLGAQAGSRKGKERKRYWEFAELADALTNKPPLDFTPPSRPCVLL